jgi:hypothetical protein
MSCARHIKQSKPPAKRPRNPLVPAARARKAGRDGRSSKAQRRQNTILTRRQAHDSDAPGY